MEFKEAMRIWKRMCCSIDGGGCAGCPIDQVSNEICRRWAGKHPAEAEAILANWAAGHPEKTIADDFFEKHPKAGKKRDGTPLACATHLGYIEKCPDDFTLKRCADCWRRPLEEV